MTRGADETKGIGPVIRIDEGELRGHVRQMVRESVEQTLNDMLEAEADARCRAKRYERSPQRVDTRAGHDERKRLTSSGEVTLRVPRLRNLPFETQIIERYRRGESSVEEALIEMYLAGVSVRRVEDITEALWGQRVSPSTVSELNQKIYATIEATTERGPPCGRVALQPRARPPRTSRRDGPDERLQGSPSGPAAGPLQPHHLPPFPSRHQRAILVLRHAVGPALDRRQVRLHAGKLRVDQAHMPVHARYRYHRGDVRPADGKRLDRQPHEPHQAAPQRLPQPHGPVPANGNNLQSPTFLLAVRRPCQADGCRGVVR